MSKITNVHGREILDSRADELNEEALDVLGYQAEM